MNSALTVTLEVCPYETLRKPKIVEATQACGAAIFGSPTALVQHTPCFKGHP